MKFQHLLPLVVALALPAPTFAAILAYEPFDYAFEENLTALTGGTGWSGGWTVNGESGTVFDGLIYTDPAGNSLDVTGLGATTLGDATTRNFRTVAGGPLTDVWVSFLYLNPGSNSKFEGVTFYRGTSEQFAVSSSSIVTTAGISLGKPGAGGSVTSAKGIFGMTHLIVLHLIEGGGANGADRVEMFIDPVFTETLSQPDAAVEAANFDFDNLRLAGQDGSMLWVDEIRIGETFADVTPHTVGSSPDSDGDGLTDYQESLLGLDPFTSDEMLITTIKDHSEWIGLYDSAEILALTRGGVIVPKVGDAPASFTFELQRSGDLISWPVVETFTRSINLPAGKNFLRVTLENP